MDDKRVAKVEKRSEKLKKLRKDLEELQSRGSICDRRDACDVAKSIVVAVNEQRVITWEELGITQDECMELARLAKVQTLKYFVNGLRLGFSVYISVPAIAKIVATSAIMLIRGKVADGTTSWKEVGTTKEEIEKLERRVEADSNW